jgi:hypothetical protein
MADRIRPWVHEEQINAGRPSLLSIEHTQSSPNRPENEARKTNLFLDGNVGQSIDGGGLCGTRNRRQNRVNGGTRTDGSHNRSQTYDQDCSFKIHTLESK